MPEPSRTLRPAPPPRGVLSATEVDGELVGQRVLPSPELSDFIHHFWLVRWDLRAPFTADALLHPAGRIELEQPSGRERAEILGVRRRAFSRTLTGAGQYFGVQFRPATLQPLVRVPMSTLTCRSVPVAQLLGPEADRWAHLTLRSATLEEQVAVTEDFLRARLSAIEPEVARLRDLVQSIASDRRTCRVEQVAKAHACDVRTLQRRFRHFVGVNPKWVIQRYRLHEAAMRLRSKQPPTLIALAAELGYADQAHFAREFRSVVGRTPGALLRERS